MPDGGGEGGVAEAAAVVELYGRRERCARRAWRQRRQMKGDGLGKRVGIAGWAVWGGLVVVLAQMCVRRCNVRGGRGHRRGSSLGFSALTE